MGRTYPLRNRMGWLGRKKRHPYKIKYYADSIRVWNPEIEREPLTGMPEVEINPQHAGYVLRNGVYVWGKRGFYRREP